MKRELEAALRYAVAVAAAQCTRAVGLGARRSRRRELSDTARPAGVAEEENDGLARVR